MSHFGGENSDFRKDIIEGLIDMLDTHNALVYLFRTTHEKLADTHIPNFKVRLYNVVGAREYELPTGDMLGAIVYEPGPETNMDYDIDDYSKDLKLLSGTGTSNLDKRLTMKAYYAYFIHDHNIIDFVREHQNDIRNEYLSGIYDAISRGDNDGSDSSRIHRDKDIDAYVSAELPSIDADPEYHSIVSELMMHGPYGLACPSAPYPSTLWKRVWRSMSEYIPYTSSISLNIPNLHIDDSQLEDDVLYELEGCLNHYLRSLIDFGMRLPPEDLMFVLRNRLLMEEKSYNRELVAKEKASFMGKLNENNNEYLI
ncbi:hypothetical protein Tco_0245952 [Tanacetum coccineum]